MNHEDGKTAKEGKWVGSLDPRLEAIATAIVDAAILVHRELGPGLLENAYEACRGVQIDAGYRLDLLVEGCVIVELKAVDDLAKIHTAQILTYLKLSGHRLGFLINFNSVPLKNGIRRFVN